MVGLLCDPSKGQDFPLDFPLDFNLDNRICQIYEQISFEVFMFIC